ncbi:phosphatidate cytidylyltransferase [Dictyobacter arantiisoli]|uniref:Phosphatidate cytidylyltransferase n=1 Tax=Dictyobacter arantiisoli TaxID=2014874 RepID=A0A5A5T9Q5_9CHLR|nr:phosphatidate cytidylyltransferase [Dictyobacter arantiisoli]GCF08241.1 phosphatidate cytidylyltransferase [Dictyobacter arantiisoli]
MQGTSKQNVTMGTNGPEKKGSSSVGQRWLTAGVMIPVVLLFVWFGGWVSCAACLLVTVLGTLELHSMLFKAGFRPLIWLSFGLSGLFLISAMFPAQRILFLQIGLGAFVILSFCWLFRRQTLEGSLVDWALSLAVPIYLGWSMSYFVLLRGSEISLLHTMNGFWVTLPHGVWWLLATLLGVWGFDGAAFFAGRYLGRHKMAPHISPAKTWEGVAGGLVVSILASLLTTVVPLGVPWYLALVLGILIGVAATLGDLGESLIKRQMHVKDSGQIMPGHGGMLDRIDSLLFAVIVVYLFSLFFH